MNYQIAKPQGKLAQFVKQYWTLDACSFNGESYTYRIVPSGLVELTFYFGERPVPISSKISFEADALFSGQQQSFYDLEVGAPLSIFAVSFLPQGAAMFFDLPLNGVTNQHIPLHFLTKESTESLTVKLQMAPSFSDRIHILEGFLLRQLSRNAEEYKMKRISYCLSHINKSKGMMQVEKLAEQVSLSKKQFERSFLAYVGTSPKRFLRTVRFQNAVHQKQLKPDLALTSLVYACGYTDQAHMIHEFKALAGVTPRKFFGGGSVFSDYFG